VQTQLTVHCWPPPPKPESVMTTQPTRTFCPAVTEKLAVSVQVEADACVAG
jgi:hypothetical protein